MSNDVKITNTDEGVAIEVTGDVKKDNVEQLTQSCSEGVCDCSPEMLEQISSINTFGQDGNMTILLKSDTLNANEVSSCMSECDCGF
jgi:hypothetical protein